MIRDLVEGPVDGKATFYKPSIDYIGVKEIVRQLKPEYRTIIDLMYFAGFSQSEVAKELGIPLGTVKTRCRAAIRELRKIIGK